MQRILLSAVILLSFSAAGLARQQAPQWKHEAESAITLYALTPFGTLLVGTASRTVALEASGNIAWSSEEIRNCRDAGRDARVFTCSVAGTDLIFVPDPELPVLLMYTTGRVVVFDAETGRRRWDTDGLGIAFRNHSVDREAGAITLWGRPSEGSDLSIARLDLVTGEERWSSSVGRVDGIWIKCDSAECPDRQMGNILLSGTSADRELVLAALDANTGALRWTTTIPLVGDIDSDVIRGVRTLLGRNRSGKRIVVGVKIEDGRILFQSEELARLFDEPFVRFATTRRSLGRESADPPRTQIDMALSPWRDREIVNSQRKRITAFSLETGAVLWQARNVELEWSSSGWTYDADTLYVNDGRTVSALRLSDGTARWSVKAISNSALSLTAQGLVVGCRLTQCTRRVELLDPGTGSRLWQGPAELPEGILGAFVKGDTFFAASATELVGLDLTSGVVSRLSRYAFGGNEYPTGFYESAQGLALHSEHNVVVLNTDWTLRSAHHYPPPGPTFSQKALSSMIAGGLNLLNAAAASSAAGTAARQNAYINASAGGPGIGIGVATYTTYFPALRGRSVAAEKVGQQLYVYTEGEGAGGQRGFSLVQFDLAEGRERGRVWVQQREPAMRVEPASSTVFVKRDDRTIEGFSFTP